MMSTEQGPGDQHSRCIWNEFKRGRPRYEVTEALYGGRQREHKRREDAVKKSMGLNDSLASELKNMRRRQCSMFLFGWQISRGKAVKWVQKHKCNI